jgi:hypothetical protein
MLGICFKAEYPDVIFFYYANIIEQVVIELTIWQ